MGSSEETEEQGNLNRFSGSFGGRGLGNPCSMSQRYASVDDIDISARSEGIETTSDGCDIYVDEFDSSFISAITLEDDIMQPSSRPVHLRLGSNLCPLQVQKPLADLPPEDVERLMDDFEDHRNLNRFSGSSEKGLGNACLLPQRRASIADIDISSRSGGTATTKDSEVSAITLDEEIQPSGRRPPHRRLGSNLSPIQEQKPLSVLPPEDVEKRMDSNEEHSNPNRFSGSSEKGLGNACLLPQRRASMVPLEGSLDDEEVQQSCKPSAIPKRRSNFEYQDFQPCQMPQRQASLGHWESNLDYQDDQQPCPMPRRKSSTRTFDDHEDYRQSYKSTFFLKEEILFESIDAADEDAGPLWSQKIHAAVRKYEERKTDQEHSDSADFLGYSPASESLDLIDVFAD